MGWVKIATVLAVAAAFLPARAADLEMKMIDNDCWIEVFEDDRFDADDPHVKIQGPQDIATFTNLQGKDWSDDIESVIVGSNAVVHAYAEKDFKGTELAFAPNQRVPDLGTLNMGNDIESMKVACGKI